MVIKSADSTNPHGFFVMWEGWKCLLCSTLQILFEEIGAPDRKAETYLSSKSLLYTFKSCGELAISISKTESLWNMIMMIYIRVKNIPAKGYNGARMVNTTFLKNSKKYEK